MSTPLGKDQVHVRITLDVVLNANGEDPDYLTERMQSEVYRAIMGKTPSALTFDSDATVASHHFAIELVEDAPKTDYQDWAYALAPTWEEVLSGRFDEGPYPAFDPKWVRHSACFVKVNAITGEITIPYEDIVMHAKWVPEDFLTMVRSRGEELAQLNQPESLIERKRIGVFMAAFGRSCSLIEPAPQVEPARSSFSHLSRQR